MRRHIVKKEITSFLFIIGLFVFAIINFIHTYPHLKEVSLAEISDLDSLQQAVTQTESIIDENVYKRYAFVEAHGVWNLILNKKEIDGFSHVKDEDGALHGANFWNGESDDVELLVDAVMQLQERAKENGTEVVVLMPPANDDAKQANFTKGVPYSDRNWVADEYLAKLGEKGIPILDFRETLKASEMTYGEKFYFTDHHWKTPAAFLCYQEFVKKMNEWYQLDLDPEGVYTNIDNYNILEYKDSTLGSHGRDTGIVYAGGLDDFIAIYPKYKTHFRYEYSLSDESDAFVSEGRFEDTLLLTNNLVNDSVYTRDKYASYLNGVCTYDKIENKEKPDAPKILFLRDSYTAPLGAFAAQLFSQTDLVWPHKLDHDLDKYVDIADYDYIVVALYPDNLWESMFRFNPVEEQ